MPEFQHQKGPQLMRVVASSAHVLVEQIQNHSWLEVTASQRSLWQNSLREKIFQLPAKPSANRNTESHLATRQILFGKESAQRAFQKILSRQAAKLVSSR